MQVLGKRTEVSQIYVDVDPNDVINNLQAKFVRGCQDSEMLGGQYINADGYWESWQDTGGSGTFSTFRKATEAETKTMEAFNIMRSVIKAPISK